MRRQFPTALALIALCVAIGGDAIAEPIASAVKKVTGRDIAKNAITGRHVKPNSLTSADVRNLRVQDFRKGEITKLRGAKGDVGPGGAPGPRGEPGASGVPGSPGTVPVASSTEPSTVSTTSASATDLGGPTVTVDVGPKGGFVQFFGTAQINTGVDPETRCDGLVTSPSLSQTVLIILRTNSANVFVDTFTSIPVSRPVGPGQHTFRLDYLRQLGTSTCEFRERTLTVALFEN